jgi:hypothetical protein
MLNVMRASLPVARGIMSKRESLIRRYEMDNNPKTVVIAALPGLLSLSLTAVLMTTLCSCSKVFPGRDEDSHQDGLCRGRGGWRLYCIYV